MSHREHQQKLDIKSKYKHFVRFDTGKITPEQVELNKMARTCNHMSDALYQASKLGWDLSKYSIINNNTDQGSAIVGAKLARDNEIKVMNATASITPGIAYPDIEKVVNNCRNLLLDTLFP